MPSPPPGAVRCSFSVICTWQHNKVVDEKKEIVMMYTAMRAPLVQCGPGREPEVLIKRVKYESREVPLRGVIRRAPMLDVIPVQFV